MREIKFRAWNYKDKIFYHSHYHSENASYLDLNDFQKLEIFFNVLNEFKNQFESVEQSVGIKDKNAVDIYEGDIVKFDDNLYYIEFRLGAFCITDKDEKSIDRFPITDYYYEELEKLEVTGNIHENPELLGD